jgi:hypothetical protein
MKLRGWWRWWRRLPQNPVYKREKGEWGTPNPYYATIQRYSPFVVMGAILLGLCAGTSNISLFSAADEAMFIAWCLICVPGALLSMLTLFASFMAPALTAPTISLEKINGTWDILRMTPQSTHSILMAKLFGALARLRIWPLLFLLTIFQGLVVAFVTIILAQGGIITALGIGGALLTRPWLEIIFAAFTGMYLSTVINSATSALAGSYAIILAIKLFNSNAIWGLLLLFNAESGTPGLLAAANIGPVLIYVLLIGALWYGIMNQAEKLVEES